MNTLKEQILFNFNNEINCIPVGFNRFKIFYPGFIKGTYTALTGGKDAGKTLLLTHMLRNAMEFVREIDDPEKVDIKIFIFLTKQSKKQFRAKMLSSFLKRDYNIEIPYIELLSIPPRPERKLTEEILGFIHLYDPWFEYFDSKVELFDNKKKPSEIYNYVRKWIEGEAEQNNTTGEWKYNNPNLFVVCCTDSTNSLQTEMDKGSGLGMDLRKTMDKHSVSNMVDLKNIYHCVIVDVHDQAVDQEKVEYDYTQRPVEEKLEPTIAGLGDNKTNNRVYDFILGLHNPAKYNFTSHKGYNVAKLGDNYRCLHLLSGMFSSGNKHIGMYFDGAVGDFSELPKSEEIKDQISLERYLKKMRNGK